jgi:acyl carrier protein
MIPACFVKIDRVPLNTNGKIDRKKLPQPLESDFHSGGTFKAPDSDIQKIIAEIWKEILSREKVGIQDNFFDLGGNSLDFAKVGNKLKEKLNREVPVVTLYTYPTIAALELYLTGDREEEIMQENQPDRLELIDEGKDLMFQTLNKLDKEN